MAEHSTNPVRRRSPEPSIGLESNNLVTIESQTNNIEKRAVLEVARDIMWQMTRQALCTALWTLQLFLLPLTRLSIRPGSTDNLSSLETATSLAKATVAIRRHILQQIIQYLPCRVALSLWTRAVQMVCQPIHLWQRLNHLVARFEAVELRVLEANYCLLKHGSSISDAPSTISTSSPGGSPFLPLTAPQVYHAAQIGNETLDDLAASVEGEKGLKVNMNNDTRTKSRVEAQRTPQSPKYSTTASLIWSSHLPPA